MRIEPALDHGANHLVAEYLGIVGNVEALIREVGLDIRPGRVDAVEVARVSETLLDGLELAEDRHGLEPEVEVFVQPALAFGTELATEGVKRLHESFPLVGVRIAVRVAIKDLPVVVQVLHEGSRPLGIVARVNALGLEDALDDVFLVAPVRL